MTGSYSCVTGKLGKSRVEGGSFGCLFPVKDSNDLNSVSSSSRCDNMWSDSGHSEGRDNMIPLHIASWW